MNNDKLTPEEIARMTQPSHIYDVLDYLRARIVSWNPSTFEYRLDVLRARGMGVKLD